MSFVLCERIWSILDDHLRHLLLMMDSDCPLAFRHKKGEYICSGFLLIGGDFCFCGAIRLYLGASLCIYIFWLMMYCVWIIHVKGRYNDLYMFLVSHYLLIYIYEVIHDICLYFIVCEIKKLFLFCLYFPHTRLCVC